jgi:Zn-finger protein
MKDFRLAAVNVNVMWSFCTFFKCEILMLGKFVSFIASCTLCITVEAERVIKRRVRNNRENDDGLEYLKH